MSFDLSSIFFILVALMALQPLLMGRWYALRRAQAIRAIEKKHHTRVITMIHRQEKRSLFGFAVSRHIDLEDATTGMTMAARVRVSLNPGQTASIDSVENKSLTLKCGDDAETLAMVDSNTRLTANLAK